MNQSKIRRTFRANLAETTSTKLEQAMRRYNLSRMDFCKIMASKNGPYSSAESCFAQMSRLVNGRYVSDIFCANIINTISNIEKNPSILTNLKNRQGFNEKMYVGQSLKSRDGFFSSDKNNKGNFFVRRILRQALKNSN